MRSGLMDRFMSVNGLTVNGEYDSYPSLGIITQTKKLALRRGAWFRVLNRVERGIIDLTVRYVDCIRSKRLAKVVTAIMEKLQYALESVVGRLMRTVGLPLARKLSDIAVSWGNRLASTWADDLAFARFLVSNLTIT